MNQSEELGFLDIFVQLDDPRKETNCIPCQKYSYSLYVP